MSEIVTKVQAAEKPVTVTTSAINLRWMLNCFYEAVSQSYLTDSSRAKESAELYNQLAEEIRNQTNCPNFINNIEDN